MWPGRLLPQARRRTPSNGVLTQAGLHPGTLMTQDGRHQLVPPIFFACEPFSVMTRLLSCSLAALTLLIALPASAQVSQDWVVQQAPRLDYGSFTELGRQLELDGDVLAASGYGGVQVFSIDDLHQLTLEASIRPATELNDFNYTEFALDGDRLVVYFTNYLIAGPSHALIQIYERDAATRTWALTFTQQTEIQIVYGLVNLDILLRDELLLIGYYEPNENNPEQLDYFVSVRRKSNNWQQTQRLQLVDAPELYFGQIMRANSSHIFIGAPQGDGEGKIFVYEDDAGMLTQLARIDSPTEELFFGDFFDVNDTHLLASHDRDLYAASLAGLPASPALTRVRVPDGLLLRESIALGEGASSMLAAISLEKEFDAMGALGDEQRVRLLDLEGLKWRDDILFSDESATLFGEGLALQGNRLIISAPRANEVPPPFEDAERVDSGRVALYTCDFKTSCPLSDQAFGNSTLFSGFGDTLTTSSDSIFANQSAPSGSIVHVFERAQSTFTHTQTLRQPPSLPLSQSHLTAFGQNISADGDQLAITSATGSAERRSPVVLAYERRDGAWAHTQTIEKPEATIEEADTFGQTLLLRGDDLWVGDSLADQRRGAVYYFVRGANPEAPWTLHSTIRAPSALEASSTFSDTLAIKDDTLIVGATKRSNDGSGQNGEVFLYQRNDATALWEQVDTLQGTPTQDQGSAYFGGDIATHGDTMAIGERGKQNVHMFRHQEDGTWALEQVIHDGAMQAEYFGNTVALGQDLLAVGGFDYLALYVRTQEAASPWKPLNVSLGDMLATPPNNSIVEVEVLGTQVIATVQNAGFNSQSSGAGVVAQLGPMLTTPGPNATSPPSMTTPATPNANPRELEDYGCQAVQHRPGSLPGTLFMLVLGWLGLRLKTSPTRSRPQAQ